MNTSKAQVEIIGAVADETVYTPEQITKLLGVERTALGHGEQFTGRPGTELHVGAGDVVKLRLDAIQINPRVWLRRTLDTEQTLQAHHPRKTWFLLRKPDDRRFLTGNICPLLTPLHTLLGGLDPTKQPTRGVELFKKLFQLYFRTYAQGWRLDMGLSNFGVDAHGALFYLDDDVYPGNDGFTDFGHMIGVYMRSQAWLDAGTGAELGRAAAGFATEEKFTAQECQAASESLSAVFLPSGRPSEASRAFIDAFAADLKTLWIHERSRFSPPPSSAEALKVEMPRTLSGRYIAILSDVHANYHALRAVMDFLVLEGIRSGIVIGDVVGYGPHPVQCIETIAESGFLCTKGNHDEAVTLGEGVWRTARSMMSRDARWVVEWTKPKLAPDHLRWLAGLPLTVAADDWIALHGAPVDPQVIHGYVYEMTFGANLEELDKRGVRLCFHGHTHVCGIYGRKRGLLDAFYHPDSSFDLNTFSHTLVCSGAVGQPRNGKPGAQFGIYDREKQSMTFRCLPYNIALTVDYMSAHGFPASLMRRLETGL